MKKSPGGLRRPGGIIRRNKLATEPAGALWRAPDPNAKRSVLNPLRPDQWVSVFVVPLHSSEGLLVLQTRDEETLMGGQRVGDIELRPLDPQGASVVVKPLLE